MGWRWRRQACARPNPSRRDGWPWAAFVIALSHLLGAAPGTADEGPASGREAWAGADVSENVWMVYSGATLAPWSAMHEPGWRVRVAGGYGAYSYSKTPTAKKDDESREILAFDATTYFTDVLVGYLVRLGDLTAKAFVGASVVSHDITPDDVYTIASGDEVGVKGVIELWLNMGERGWGSLDLSWSSAHETRSARSRVGYRVWPRVSLGLEAGLNVDAQGECRMKKAGIPRCGFADRDPETGEVHRRYEAADLLDYARGGAFARYEWDAGEASVSAGVLGESFAAGDEIELAPYMTVNWLTRF